MRPGLSGLSEMQLTYGNAGGKSGGGTFVDPGSGPPPDAGNQADDSYPCTPGSCVANPEIQEVGALPAGTSAPNTVITEHAVHQLHLQTSTSGWLIQTAHPFTAAQINSAQRTAAAAGMTVESKNDEPTSAEIINWATVFGIALALGVLAMSVGLIRSETAADLRTLAATGASSSTRRTITGGDGRGAGLARRGARDGGRLRGRGGVVPGQRAQRRSLRPLQRAHREPADHPGRDAGVCGGGRVAPRRAPAAVHRATAHRLIATSSETG